MLVLKYSTFQYYSIQVIFILAFIRHFNRDIKKKVFVRLSEVIRENIFYINNSFIIIIPLGQRKIFVNDSLQFFITFRFNITLRYFSTSSFISKFISKLIMKKKLISICYMKRYFSDIFVNSFISCSRR